jgi:hypothetical protein
MRQSHEDRRKYARQAVLLPCRVDGVKTKGSMQVTDLSAGGCFVATRDPVDAGSEVTIHARLAGVELPLPGRVVYVKTGRGFAIEFGNLASDTRYLLEQFLTRVLMPKS